MPTSHGSGRSSTARCSASRLLAGRLTHSTASAAKPRASPASRPQMAGHSVATTIIEHRRRLLLRAAPHLGVRAAMVGPLRLSRLRDQCRTGLRHPPACSLAPTIRPRRRSAQNIHRLTPSRAPTATRMRPSDGLPRLPDRPEDLTSFSRGRKPVTAVNTSESRRSSLDLAQSQRSIHASILATVEQPALSGPADQRVHILRARLCHSPRPLSLHPICIARVLLPASQTLARPFGGRTLDQILLRGLFPTRSNVFALLYPCWLSHKLL